MEQRASLGSLPLELQSAILRTLCSSLTTITRDTARVSRAPRQKDLATLGSTSRHWHRVSRPFLWADPLLLSETSLRAFLACLLSTPSVGQLVVRLNLGHFVLSPGELEFLASKTPSLQTLYLKCPPAALGAKTSDAAAALERLMSHTPRLQRLSIELARETETTDLQKQATSGSGSFSTISSPGAVKHTGALGWSPAALPCTMNVLRHLTHLDLYMGMMFLSYLIIRSSNSSK